MCLFPSNNQSLQVGPSLAINYMAYETLRSSWLAATDRPTPTVSPLLRKAQAPAGSCAGSSGAADQAMLGPEVQHLLLASRAQSRPAHRPSSPTLPTHHLQVAMSLACGSAAGLVSSTVTFPLDLIRRRLQLAGTAAAGGGSGGGGGGGLGGRPGLGGGSRATFRSVLAGVLQQEGVRGLYAGILPEYYKVGWKQAGRELRWLASCRAALCRARAAAAPCLCQPRPRRQQSPTSVAPLLLLCAAATARPCSRRWCPAWPSPSAPTNS